MADRAPHQTPLRVILAWSKEDVEREQAKKCIVVPLATGGYLASESSGRTVLDTEAVLGKAPELWNLVGSSLRKTLADLTNRDASPWMGGCPPEKLTYAIHLVIVWQSLLKGIEREMGTTPYEIVPPMAFHDPSHLRDRSFDTLAMKIFWICFRSHGTIGREPSIEPSKIRHAGKHLRKLPELCTHATGCILNRLAPIFLYEEMKMDPTRPRIFRLLEFLMIHACTILSLRQSVFSSYPRITLLLAGTQYTDSFHQAPLAKRLYRRYGKAFLWLTLNIRNLIESADVTPEEKSHIEAMNEQESPHLAWDTAPNVSWVHPALARVSDTHVLGSIARILSEAVPSSLSRTEWVNVLRECGIAGLREKYERRSRLLSALSPRAIVGLSTLTDMAFIRSWARRNSVPFVLFPHGVFPVVSQQYHVDGDYLGVFGKIMADQVAASGLSRAREVARCGSMQFGSSVPTSPFGDSGKPQAREHESFLYIPGHALLPFFPVSMNQRWREIRAIHAACMHVGRKLVVREHPRGGKKELAPFIDELKRTHPGTIDMSRDPSLLGDISSAQAVIASIFDGATLNALLYRRIVVAYIEKGQWNSSIHLFEKLGCFARNPEDLREILRAIVQGGDEAQDIYTRQQRFLDEYFEGLGDDPWKRADAFIEKVLQACS